MVKLRPYQGSAVKATFEFLINNDGAPIIVLPTGSGKSVVISDIIIKAIEQYAETRVVCLSHVAEILIQNAQELLGMWPEAPVGIYSASLGQRNIKAQVLFASVQSVHNRAIEIQRCDLLIIDECHLISRDGNSMYRKLINMLRLINPYMRIIGTSATPYRLDSGHLCHGKDAIFTHVAYEANVKKLIEQGYLSPLITRPINTTLDVSNVTVRGGEYIPAELEAACDIDSITQAAVDEIVYYGQDRRAWLAFATGVSHAFHIRDAIRERGFTCETVTGETPKPERKAILDAYKAGKIRCLTNANVLTTGVNVRPIDLLAYLRPTKSLSLYIQMTGRGMRLSPETGKKDALVLDFSKLITMHGPIDFAKPSTKRKSEEKSAAPTKKCPNCGTGVYLAAPECPDCGYVFPPPAPKLEHTSSVLPIISEPPQWVKVSRASYKIGQKEGNPPYVRITYQCGLAFHGENICIEHKGYPKIAAQKLWEKRAGTEMPETTDEVFARSKELMVPSEIQVLLKGKYTEVVGTKFA